VNETLAHSAIVGRGPDAQWGLTEDLSLGGVLIGMLVPPPVGQQVLLKIHLPERWRAMMPFTGDLMLRGTVRWHRKRRGGRLTGCGIEFDRLHEQTFAWLAALYDAAERLGSLREDEVP